MVAAGPSRDEAARLLRPDEILAADIRALITERLGRVLPPEPSRGTEWYYRSVVLGARAAEALQVLGHHVQPGAGPVVDVGCGLGSFVLLANRLDVPALGFEPSAAELGLARARAATLLGGRNVFARATGEQLPMASSTASAVLLHDVLEHVEQWREVLAECRRVLAPGGIVYVKGPSYAVRFYEPHFRLAWLPLLPRPMARRYLAARGRDVGYLEEVRYRRRGEVLGELRRLGFSLHFPRRDKARDVASINRPWARRSFAALNALPGAQAVTGVLAENPLQSTVDVVARWEHPGR